MATPLCKWCMKKSRFSTITAGWSRAITIWTVHYSLSHKSRRPCWRYKQYPVMKGTAAHQWILFMTQANEATSKTNCPKNILTRCLETYADIATKRAETTSGIELYHHAKFHAASFNRPRDICFRNNKHTTDLTIYVHIKMQSNGLLYSNTVIGTLAVDGWAVTFGTARRGPGRAAASPLFAVPNVTAHPSTASVRTSYYLMWHFFYLFYLWTFV